MSEKVVITGAAGFIGFHAASAFLKKGHDLVIIDNLDPYYNPQIKRQNISDLQILASQFGRSIQFLEMDICDVTPENLGNLDISGVIHLAAKAGVRPSLEEPEAYGRVNVIGTIRILEVARKLNISRIVFGSSSSVYGNDTPVPFSEEAIATLPISPYAASKRAAELFCLNHTHLYGLKTAALRFFTVYGPRQRPDLAIHKFSRLILNGESIPFYGDGMTSRDYTFVSDIVSGIEQAWAWTKTVGPGTYEVFNLGHSEMVPLRKLIQLLEAGLMRKAEINLLPMQPGDVEQTYADISKAAKKLQYHPEVSIEDGIQLFCQWFLNQVGPGSTLPGLRNNI